MQNPTFGLFCLEGDLKTCPDSVQEHTCVAEYRRAHHRLRVEIKTQNQDSVKKETKYLMRISVIFVCALCIIIITLFGHS